MFLFNKKSKSNAVLIVGLGNPGLDYQKSRHNSGFLFIDELAKQLSEQTEASTASFNIEAKFEAELAIYNFKSKKILLAKPQTFMNDSGRSVSKIVNYYNIDKENLFVAYDDLDLQLGAYKIQKGKFPKSHNGVNSIIEHIKSTNFVNVRIGIDSRRKDNPIESKDFVLSRFSDYEFEILNGVIHAAGSELIEYYL